MRCEVSLLGTPEIRVSGVVQTHVRHKTLALIAFLLVEDRPVRRDTLAALLWPNSGQAFARRNLRTCLHDARRALGDHAFEMSGDVVRLEPSAVQSDIQRLRQLESSDRASSPGPEHDAFLTRALLGGFMEGLSLPDTEEFDTWQLQTGEALRTRLSRIAAERVAVELDHGRSNQILELGRALVRSDPLDEAHQELLLRILAAEGDWGSALRQFELYRTTLMSELGETPSPEIAGIVRRIATRDPELGPTRSGSQRIASLTGVLPEESDQLRGRHEELDQLARLLVEENRRMVTLAGVGGAGKTRLAIHFANEVQSRYPDGILFVDLTRISRPDQLLSLIQTTVGTIERATDPEESFAAVARRLDRRRALVVLD
ncbi:MAG: AfsR/SARP family transcriptional regulator, partial [Spirochaetota bacterium]